MLAKRRLVVFATFVCSCVALGLLSASLATDYWVEADAKQLKNGRPDDRSGGHVNVGLFKGRKTKTIGIGSQEYDVFIVCLPDEDACMYSCGATRDGRKADIDDLMYTNGTKFGDSCADLDRALVTYNYTASGEAQYLMYGVWVSTITMIAFGMVFAVAAAVMAVVNVVTSPIEMITGIPGLYLWNFIACLFDLAALSCWAAQFYQRLANSMMIREEIISTWTSKDMASYGYSYWLVMVACFAHLVSIATLFLGTRETRLKREAVAAGDSKVDKGVMLF